MTQLILALSVLCCLTAFAQGFATNPFNCTITCDPYNGRPSSVDRLTPCDIEVIGAIGDATTPGTRANSIPIDDFGYSFVTGSTFTDLGTEISLANILLQYNPLLQGYSTGPNDPGFNVAAGSAVVADALPQAQELVVRMQAQLNADTFQKSWKMVNIFFGANAACLACQDTTGTLTAKNFINNIKSALDYLRDNLPRTIVNFDSLTKLAYIRFSLLEAACPALSTQCPCAFGSNIPQFTKFITDTDTGIHKLVNSGRYSKTNNFTVVIQPFLEDITYLFLNPVDGTPDLSYYASNCLNLLRKAQNVFGAELWNNIIQPIGQKTTRLTVYTKDYLTCPQQTFIPVQSSQSSQSSGSSRRRGRKNRGQRGQGSGQPAH